MPPAVFPIKIFSSQSLRRQKASDTSQEVPAGWTPQVYQPLSVQLDPTAQSEAAK